MRILALDRWTKKIWLARRSSETKITFPLGVLLNTSETLTDIVHFIEKYSIDTLVYGQPHSPRLKKQVDELIAQLHLYKPAITITPCNEAYTSVQADVLLQQGNHPGQDAIAAMYILETYVESLKTEKQ